MIKRCFMTFIKGLKYYLTPFGAILLFLAIGLGIVIPLCINSVNVAINDISALLGGAPFNWNAANQVIANNLGQLNWVGDPTGALNTLCDSAFINKFLSDVFIAGFGRDDISSLVIAIANKCGGEITTEIGGLLAIMILGLIVGFVVTRMQIRHDIASAAKQPLRFFIRLAIDLVVFAGNIALLYWLNVAYKGLHIILILSIVLLGYVLITLFKAYLIYGVKKVPFRMIMNLKDVLALYLVDIIIVGVVVGVFSIFALFMNMILAIVVLIPLIVVGLIILDLNAERYVNDLANDPELIDKKKTFKIRFEKKKNRSAAYDGKVLAGFCEFEIEGSIWKITHTIVEEKYGGRGIAKKLVQKVIKKARRKKVKIKPICSYAEHMMVGNNNYKDVLAD